MTEPERILVIRHGALGDLMLCMQAFHEIRLAHPKAEIALLTAPAFAEFARAMPWFDRVLIDPHPSAREWNKWLALAAQIRAFAPARVYELHGKLRQSILYALLGGPLGPEWSGAAPFCKYPRLWPPAPGMHFKDFIAAQLRIAGVPPRPAPDLGWLDAPVEGFALPPRYAVLIPGCTPGQDYKRWPARFYADLAGRLQAKGIASVLVGTRHDADAIGVIKAAAPDVIDLGGRTDLFQLAGILRRAAFVVGNDTGPMHMAAELGPPTLALLSRHTGAAWSAPRPPHPPALQSGELAGLDPGKVYLALEPFLDRNS